MDVMTTLEKPYTKKCYRCLEVLPRDRFHTSVRRKDGLKIWCKTCSSKWNMNYHYKRKYGLTKEQVDQMHEDRNFKCDICNGSQQPRQVGKTGFFSDKLAVDHCHKTGKVRGLLCNVCNTFLGAVKDDIKILKTMINYIERQH